MWAEGQGERRAQLPATITQSPISTFELFDRIFFSELTKWDGMCRVNGVHYLKVKVKMARSRWLGRGRWSVKNWSLLDHARQQHTSVTRLVHHVTLKLSSTLWPRPQYVQTVGTWRVSPLYTLDHWSKITYPPWEHQVHFTISQQYDLVLTYSGNHGNFSHEFRVQTNYKIRLQDQAALHSPSAIPGNRLLHDSINSPSFSCYWNRNSMNNALHTSRQVFSIEYL